MNPEFLIRLELAFNEATTLVDPAEKISYLEDLAKRDTELERELRTLLALREESEEFFESREGDYASLLTTTMRVTKRVEKIDEFLEFLARASDPVAGGEIAAVRGFYLSNLIATGPTGFVFHGRDPQLCRDVAIKVLAPSIARVPEQKQAFIDEARLASTVLHDNVVLIHHISAVPDSPLVFYAMEWINGPTLQDWLEQHTQPEFYRDHAMSLLRQLADGLAAIHAHGIIHRDLKPANLMLDSSEKRLKIVDFGIAFEVAQDLGLNAPVGTPLYMSPEQLKSGTATQASDIFSLAEIACVLIWGKHPFEEKSIDRLTTRVTKGTPSLPSSEFGCGAAAQGVLRKALSTDPALRFSNAVDFVDELLNAMKTTHRDGAVSEGKASRSVRGQGANRIDPTIGDAGRAGWLPVARKRRWLFAFVGLAAVLMIIGIANLPDRFSDGFSAQPDRNDSTNPNAVQVASTTDTVRAGRWEDPDHFSNFMGMQLKRIPSLGQSIEVWPPDADHPELFGSLGWQNMRRDIWIASKLVTRRQYLKVMGIQGDSVLQGDNDSESMLSLDAPVTNVNYNDVKRFCERLTELDPDGISYGGCGRNAWTMATYGYRMIAENRRAEPLLATFRRLSRGEAVEDEDLGTMPLIDDVFGSNWEWTFGSSVKPIVLDGVVSYRERPEVPSEPFLELLGGGEKDLFVHSHDMNYGMNDYLHDSHNLSFHLESDGETCYLMPESVGERSWVSYRYRLKKGVISASVRNPFALYQDNASAGIRIRCTDRPVEMPIEECEWHTISALEGPMPEMLFEPIDVTPIVAGAVEIEVEYWLQAVETPLWHVQLGRTNQTSLLGGIFCFQAVTGGREESMRQSVSVPQSFRSPLIGFRVAAYLDEQFLEKTAE
ncbi:MAG: serine/threonine protein kinase [Planctomycetaceae bacterium]|nr:serine/threonine protein kinase [Planctomycetaceae bacterium]